MRRQGVIDIDVQDAERETPRVALIFQIETADKTPCACMAIEIIRAGHSPSLHAQKVVDRVAGQ